MYWAALVRMCLLVLKVMHSRMLQFMPMMPLTAATQIDTVIRQRWMYQVTVHFGSMDSNDDDYMVTLLISGGNQMLQQYPSCIYTGAVTARSLLEQSVYTVFCTMRSVSHTGTPPS